MSDFPLPLISPFSALPVDLPKASPARSANTSVSMFVSVSVPFGPETGRVPVGVGCDLIGGAVAGINYLIGSRPTIQRVVPRAAGDLVITASAVDLVPP